MGRTDLALYNRRTGVRVNGLSSPTDKEPGDACSTQQIRQLCVNSRVQLISRLGGRPLGSDVFQGGTDDDATTNLYWIPFPRVPRNSNNDNERGSSGAARFLARKGRTGVGEQTDALAGGGNRCDARGVEGEGRLAPVQLLRKLPVIPTPPGQVGRRIRGSRTCRRRSLRGRICVDRGVPKAMGQMGTQASGVVG